MKIVPASWGLLFAGVTLAVHYVLGRESSVLIASIMMSMIGAIYVGFAVSDGRRSAIVIESMGAIAFAAAAIGGQVVSPWFIVVALAGHACWDALHHWTGHWARPPRWYIPYCAVYDLVAAVGLAVLWFARGVISG